MTREDIRRSKFLSLVLRHRPEAAGVTLNEEGWTEVAALLDGAQRRGVVLSREDLDRVVRANDKQRFELSADGTRIRARQGHSVSVDLGLPPRVPPDVLFHGTVAPALPAIRREGLRPMKRHHVHLSPDRETATRVGARRGTPVILEIDAAGLHTSGVAFYQTENGVWLVDAVPSSFLTFPPDEWCRLSPEGAG